MLSTVKSNPETINSLECKSCMTCKYWLSDDKRVGRCTRIVKGNISNISIYPRANTDAGSLITNQSFHCALFEFKE